MDKHEVSEVLRGYFLEKITYGEAVKKLDKIGLSRTDAFNRLNKINENKEKDRRLIDSLKSIISTFKNEEKNKTLVSIVSGFIYLRFKQDTMAGMIKELCMDNEELSNNLIKEINNFFSLSKMCTKDYFSMIGSKGGRAQSEKKHKAVVENGKKGGRPATPEKKEFINWLNQYIKDEYKTVSYYNSFWQQTRNGWNLENFKLKEKYTVSGEPYFYTKDNEINI